VTTNKHTVVEKSTLYHLATGKYGVDFW